MTIDQLIASLRTQANAKLRARNECATTLAQLRGSNDAASIERVKAEKHELDAQIDALLARVDGLEREAAADRAIDKLAREITPTAPRPAYDQVARVGSEARTYRRDQDPNGRAFLTDLVRSEMFGDPGARERLARHHQEDQVERGQYLQRATGTGAFSGLTVPQYLTDMYAPATAALRPFADICNPHQLPESGMTVNISRITTPSSVALQANQNDAVAEQDMDDTLLTEPVQTAAGQQTVSRQAIERGTGIEDVTMQDLMNRWATTLDSTLLNQATTGLSALGQSTAYTDASPTVAELWPKLFQSQNALEAALLAQAFPTHFVMHPRRWNWMTSQVGTSWPTIGANVAPVQSYGIALTNEYGVAVRGVLSNGMRVTVDANIATNLGAGTNEDEIYTVAAAECHLWEDPNAPLFIRAEQAKAANLGVLIVVYGYFAYSFRRYTNGVGKISGTGLITPTF